MNKTIEPVYLKDTDLLDLQKHVIGKGSDATVYNAGGNLLYKIYHRKQVYDDIKFNKTNDSDIKTDLPSVFLNTIGNFPTVFDENGVKLAYDSSISKAIEKQKVVQKTRLPLAAIYINGHFRGCVLHYYKHYFSLYNIISLPMDFKRKILLKLLHKVNELLDNYIYHFDLCNRPIGKLSHSNILVSFAFEPEIIDIDGKSAMYRSEFNIKDYKKTLLSFKLLLLEILFDIELSDSINEMDLMYLEQLLCASGVKDTLIEKLLYTELSLEDSKLLLENSMLKKVRYFEY